MNSVSAGHRGQVIAPGHLTDRCTLHNQAKLHAE